MAPRSKQQRKLDALDKLQSDEDVWVATAGVGGKPHLVPFSLAWDGQRVIAMTERSSVTARNLLESPRARLALGHTRDVVMLDVAVETVPLAEAPASAVEVFILRTGWDPRRESGSWVMLLMTPRRVQAWRGPDEMDGRTLMRAGEWVDG